MPREPKLREGLWPDDEAILEAIRRRVFIEEQGVPREIEWDGREVEALHAIAELDGEPIGCGRLLPDGRIGRLAVLPAFRGQGVGARLLEMLLGLARRRGQATVHLHAQLPARAFYERAGFRVRGEPFQEAGIAHIDMELQLDYGNWQESIAGLRYPSPFDQLVIAQARLARRELCVLSPRLDPRLFEQEAFTDALRALARRERQARVRILVGEAREVVARGHALLTLARRVPTKIHLRRLAEHADWRDDTAVIRDRDSLLALPGGELDPGFYRPGDRARCETALSRFEELWRAGSEDPEFRALML
jgi:predicted GNAT family N-acyltransferase